ncbi:MAG: O-methyltransferase [Flavobacteriaceae bacterium]|nr:O-methyltransferase [Flavobacteriaceae bacterium]
MDLISEKIINYSLLHSKKESELLKNLYRETYLKVLNPRMICSPLQGRLLSILSKIIKPKKILEIGTFTGYSTLCLAEGLSTKGEIHTIDNNEELLTIQKQFFNNSAYKKNIIQHLGYALNLIPKLNHSFDLIFLDADKINYINYYNIIIPKLKSGGLLISDNVLWSGKVISSSMDKETNILKKYNKLVNKDKRMESVLLPIRDGITLSIKV